MISIQDLGSIATAISIIFIAWYAFESYKTRKNTIRPTLIMFAIRNRKGGHWTLKLKNIGIGATTSIKIKSYESDGKIKLVEEKNYLSPNEETDVVFQYQKTAHEDKDFSKFPFFKTEFEILVKYTDIEGKKYHSKILHSKNHRFKLVESKEESENLILHHK
jgi:hypothetical protein